MKGRHHEAQKPMITSLPRSSPVPTCPSSPTLGKANTRAGRPSSPRDQPAKDGSRSPRAPKRLGAPGSRFQIAEPVQDPRLEGRQLRDLLVLGAGLALATRAAAGAGLQGPREKPDAAAATGASRRV